jgi:hypothetical protein
MPDRLAGTLKVMADGVRAADKPDPRLAMAKPVDPRVREAAIGRYYNERLGDLHVGEQSGELIVTGGVFSAPLRSLGGDKFVLLGAAGSAVEPFELVRDGAGRVTAFLWDDDRFDRAPKSRGERG